MYESSAEKERLLMALTDIYDQLEELESVLEDSFSDLRIRLNEEEQVKIADSEKKITILEHKIEKMISVGSGEVQGSRSSKSSNVLKLEMGY